MRAENATREEVEAFMLSGREFTYLDAYATLSIDNDASRLIDKTIQRLRKKGLISFRRIPKRGCVWKRAELWT